MITSQCTIGKRVIFAGTGTDTAPPVTGLIAGNPVVIYGESDASSPSSIYVPVLLDDPLMVQDREFTVSVLLLDPDELDPGGSDQ